MNMTAKSGRLGRFAVYAAALILIGLGEDSMQSVQPILPVCLLMALGLTLLTAAVRQSGKLRYYLATVPALLMIAFVVRYCVGAVVVVAWRFLPWTTALNRAAYEVHSVRSYIGAGCYLAMIAGLGLYAGATMPVKLPFQLKHTDDSDIRQLRPVTPVLLLICSLIALWLTPKVPSEWQQFVHVVGALSSLLIAVSAFVASTTRKHLDRQRWWLICGVGCTLFAMQGLGNGARETFIKPVIFATIGYIAARRRIPWAPMLIAILLLLFAGLPILNSAKHEIIERGGSGGIGGLRDARSQVASSDYSLTMENVVSNLLQRLSLVTYPALYSQFYPHIFPWLHGETLVLEAQELVPRAIWRQKPEIGRILDGYAQQVGVIGKDDTKSSAKFDFVSEYYINFGAWGLFVFSWLDGFFFRCLELAFRTVVSPLVAALIVAVTIVDNNDFFSAGMLWPGILKQFVIWSLILSVVCRKTRVGQPQLSYAFPPNADLRRTWRRADVYAPPR